MTSATGCLTKPFALLLYFVGAYAWTWFLSLLKILAQRDIISIPVPFIVLDIAAALGTLVAALAVTSYESGGEGRRALLGQTRLSTVLRQAEAFSYFP